MSDLSTRTQMVSFEGRGLYKVVADVKRGREPKTFYVDGSFPLSVPSVAGRDAPIVLKGQQLSMSKQEVSRRVWDGRLYAPVRLNVYGDPTVNPRITLTTVGRVASSLGGFATIIRPWLGKKTEKLFWRRDNLSQWVLGDIGPRRDSSLPVNVTLIRESTYADCADRLNEIAGEGLLFVDGELYQAKPMPTLIAKGSWMTVDDAERDDLRRDGDGFVFSLDRLEDALQFMQRHWGCAEHGFKLRIDFADEQWLRATPEVERNALYGIEQFFTDMQRFSEEIETPALDAMVRMATIRERIQSGENAATDLVAEMRSLAENGFWLPRSSDHRKDQLIKLVPTVTDAVTNSRDYGVVAVKPEAPEPEEIRDDGLSGLRM